MTGALGLNKVPDTEHLDKYPLSALPLELHPIHVPVPIGINWYEGFDIPQQGSDGKWRISISGAIRGGHCVCLEPAPQSGQPELEQEKRAWWKFYNQGPEGACVGFGHSRMMSLLYRRTFDGFWLYDDCRRYEGTYPDGEGSTCRTAGAVLKKWGDHFEGGDVATHTPWRPNTGGIEIGAYRWTTKMADVLQLLGLSSGGEVPLLNSWGEGYPEVVYFDPETTGVQILDNEAGEASVITTR